MDSPNPLGSTFGEWENRPEHTTRGLAMLSRRQFVAFAGAGIFGGGGYGLYRAVHNVRDAASRMTDQ